MNLSDITKKNLLFFNNLYKENEKNIEKDHEDKNELDANQTKQLFNKLFLTNISEGSEKCLENRHVNKEIDNPKEINDIKEINFIDDYDFIYNMMTFRRLEIMRYVAIIKVLMEQYKHQISAAGAYEKHYDKNDEDRAKLNQNIEKIEARLNILLRDKAYYLEITICKYITLYQSYKRITEMGKRYKDEPSIFDKFYKFLSSKLLSNSIVYNKDD
jgi:hypothetical protein